MQDPELQEAANLLRRKFESYNLTFTRPPQPLVEILVRTIDRKESKIPLRQFPAYMDGVSEDFLQFSMGVFNNCGQIKPSLYDPSSLSRGTGVWGPEINHGTLAYIEDMRVSPRCRRQGLGQWAIENLLKSDVLAHCPFFFVMPAVYFTGPPFSGPEPDFDAKKQAVVSFWHYVGFRRIAGTIFFGYARNPKHPMRSLRVEDDAGEKQTKVFTSFDAYD